MKIASKCNLEINKDVKEQIVRGINEGKELNGVPLQADYMIDYGMPLIRSLSSELDEEAVKSYLDLCYE